MLLEPKVAAAVTTNANIVRCRKQAVEVVRRRLESKGADMLQADGFDVHSIHVYRTDPEDKLCKTWKRIKELELTSK